MEAIIEAMYLGPNDKQKLKELVEYIIETLQQPQ